MNIYTSYFSKIKQLEAAGIVPIAICAKCPDWYKGKKFKLLTPSYDCLMNYKRDGNADAYVERYNKETLSVLSPQGVLSSLAELSDGKDVALICFEKPADFCHRHLVADWLNSNGTASVSEWQGTHSIDDMRISELNGVSPDDIWGNADKNGKQYRWFWAYTHADYIAITEHYCLNAVGEPPVVFPCTICLETLDYPIDFDKGERYATATVYDFDRIAQATDAFIKRVIKSTPDGLKRKETANG